MASEASADQQATGEVFREMLQLLRQRGLALENVTLVVVDDDTDYNPNLICEYARAELRYPGAALGCTAAAC